MFGHAARRKQLRAILELARSGITEQNHADAVDLVEHGEPGLALELVCEQLYELESPVSHELFQSIVEAAGAMKMPDKTWSPLTELLRSSG